MLTVSDDIAAIEQQVRDWLQQVVMGLELCPFARRPYENQQVKFAFCFSHEDEQILQALLAEMQLLDELEPEQLETTLLLLPEALPDFLDFNQFLDQVDALIEEHHFTGVFQVASFHPQYQFADTDANDVENLTNRAPYPILHILREESLEQALKVYPQAEQIPERNIQTMRDLSESQIQRLFPYLL